MKLMKNMIFKAYLRHATSLQNIAMKLNSWQKVRKESYHKIDEAVSLVSLSDMKRALKIANYPVSEGHACISTNLLLCDNGKKKDCQVHINKMTGFFVCASCKRVGSWNVLERAIQPNKTNQVEEELKHFFKSCDTLQSCSEGWIEIKKLELMEKLPIERYKKIVEKFHLQDVPQQVMSQMNVYYQESSETLYFPLLAFQNVITGYRTLCIDTVSKTVPELNASGVIIFKQKNVKSDGPAVLVPNIEDLLAIAAKKAANIIVCLPYGLQNIPQQILPSLELYKKLVLWFGNDEPSWDTARHFAKKLNEKRCYFVRPTDDQPQAKTAASLGYDLKEIIKNAQPIWHKSITTFRGLRQDVLSDLQNVEKVQGVKWVRYPTLNKILKGHRRGEFTVLTGPTGCGKTTFMSEYSLDLAMQGINTLWGSFEIRNARLARTMLQQMAGLPLGDNLEKFDGWANEFEKLPIYFMTFHGQQDVKDVMETIEHATYVHDIAHVIIDNIQFMMGMADEPKYMDRFWKQDKIIASFRTFATKFNCHVSLVIHPRKERDDGELTNASIFGGAKASQEADNVLIIQDKRLTNVKGKKYLQISKNRFSGDLGMMVLDFDKSSLSYAAKNKSKKEEEETAIIIPNESVC